MLTEVSLVGPGGGKVRYVAQYIKRREADEQFASCMEEIAWQEQDVIVFGRVVKQPRLTGGLGQW